MAAAKKLYDLGVTNILVLEADDRIGGRIKSVLFNGEYVEEGAQFVHGTTGNSVYEVLSTNF